MRPQAGIRPATACSACNSGKPKRESAQHRRPGASGVPGQQGAYSRNWYSVATGGYIQDERALGKREGNLAKIVIIGGGVIGSSIAYHLAQAGDASDVVVVEPDPTYEFAVSTSERNCIGGRRKNTSRAEIEVWPPRSVAPKLSFPVRSVSLLSRPDLASPGHGAQRRGWEERSHAQQREHGEHRTFPVVSTVARSLPVGLTSGAGVACSV